MKQLGQFQSRVGREKYEGNRVIGERATKLTETLVGRERKVLAWASCIESSSFSLAL
jgi:hypothetical protein